MGYSKNDEALVKKVKNIYYHLVPIRTKFALNVEIKICKNVIPRGLRQVRNKIFFQIITDKIF